MEQEKTIHNTTINDLDVCANGEQIYRVEEVVSDSWCVRFGSYLGIYSRSGFLYKFLFFLLLFFLNFPCLTRAYFFLSAFLIL